jgi:ABC-type Fe3+-siderophore transport system permease subunit
MRDVLVGSLCAIALFLFFYKGYNKWENRAGNVAGFFAIGIAWFPTAATDPQTFTGKIHFMCAAAFFIILALFSIFFFTRKVPHPTKRKLKRNVIYVVCGLIMIACLAAILIYFNFFHTDNADSQFVFWAESIALIAFGVSWLTKGGTLYPDK